mmetsp:Transcript_8082/g.17257  ORF Transcript_8082/g.17257 Transcript_8082/m.17257 type:complete len:203 (+) Transcript_8082:300-908(+)
MAASGSGCAGWSATGGGVGCGIEAPGISGRDGISRGRDGIPRGRRRGSAGEGGGRQQHPAGRVARGRPACARRRRGVEAGGRVDLMDGDLLLRESGEWRMGGNGECQRMVITAEWRVRTAWKARKRGVGGSPWDGHLQRGVRVRGALGPPRRRGGMDTLGLPCGVAAPGLRGVELLVLQDRRVVNGSRLLGPPRGASPRRLG